MSMRHRRSGMHDPAVAIRDTAPVARRCSSLGIAGEKPTSLPAAEAGVVLAELRRRMHRPARTGRPAIDSALTLRLTREDRELLEQLVSMRASELSNEGYEATVAGYIRGLIRREAAARGLSPRDTHGEGPGHLPT